ncbi:15634_t:CDS:10 [Racocetra persica]|uniref:15634_t:CDS:1 n=1 Tax=Racocetra persica TaxID=160502 RepID=A0ACA9LIK1_9GLOM|nr:15634_t:CDS:10 [Racocetra persica]
MGWNPYNQFHGDANENIIKAHADIIADKGYLDVGYRYINLDDGWQGPIRLALASYIHSKGLLFGIYSDAGYKTCGGSPGSLGFETIDAETFVEWGVDYLKYDNCNNDGRPEPERFQVTTKGNKSQIFYNIVEWGTSNPWLWGPAIGNSWRTSVDIDAFWPSIISIIDSQARLTQYGKPGGWNDPDMLVVGFPAIPFQEQVTHFCFWAALKAPLILGYDLSNEQVVNGTIKDLMTNIDIISVNQDPLGKSVCQVHYVTNGATSFDIWTGPLSDGYVAHITLDFKNHCRLTGNILIRDLVKQTNIGNFTTDSYTATNIPRHGVAFLKLIGGDVVNGTSPCLYNV